MDTSWFRRAVDQHAIEPDSFVFSVPFDSGYQGKNSSVLVTAAHAMFVEHRGHKAAAAVVGLQYTHESLSKHFINITSAVRILLPSRFRFSTEFLSSAPAPAIAGRPARLTSSTATCWTTTASSCFPSAPSTPASSLGRSMERLWIRWSKIGSFVASRWWTTKASARIAIIPTMQPATGSIPFSPFPGPSNTSSHSSPPGSRSSRRPSSPGPPLTPTKTKTFPSTKTNTIHLNTDRKSSKITWHRK